MDTKKDDRASARPSTYSSGFNGGGGGGGKPSDDSKGPRKFGPRGFKSVTDLSPPPTPMMGCSSGGCCG